MVGSGNPPLGIKDADLVINIFGPEIRTFEEQLQLLNRNGRLLVAPPANCRHSAPDGYQSVPITVNGRITGYQYTRE